MNLLIPGLEEALRLMALDDLDYAPGRILTRIKQLKGETMNETTVYNPVTCLREEIDRFKSTNRFSPMLVTNFYVQAGIVLDRLVEVTKDRDALHAKLATVEAQAGELRNALDTLTSGLASWKMFYALGGEVPDELKPGVELAKQALSDDCGKSLLTRLEEARWLVDNATRPGTGALLKEWMDRRDAWLSGHTPTV